MKTRGLIRLGILASVIYFGYQHWSHIQMIQSLASERIINSAEQTCLKQEPSDPVKAAECFSLSKTAIYGTQSHVNEMYWRSGIYDVSLGALAKILIGWIIGVSALAAFRWVQRGFQ